MRITGSLTIRTDGFTVRAGFGKTCALRAPTVFSARMKSASARKTRLLIKARQRGVIRDRRLRADTLFIRTQSVIRADGARSAQVPTVSSPRNIATLQQNRARIKSPYMQWVLT